MIEAGVDLAALAEACWPLTIGQDTAMCDTRGALRPVIAQAARAPGTKEDKELVLLPVLDD